jgi:hypothetical protein
MQRELVGEERDSELSGGVALASMEQTGHRRLGPICEWGRGHGMWRLRGCPTRAWDLLAWPATLQRWCEVQGRVRVAWTARREAQGPSVRFPWHGTMTYRPSESPRFTGPQRGTRGVRTPELGADDAWRCGRDAHGASIDAVFIWFAPLPQV